jgi:hypothetical protein
MRCTPTTHLRTNTAGFYSCCTTDAVGVYPLHKTGRCGDLMHWSGVDDLLQVCSVRVRRETRDTQRQLMILCDRFVRYWHSVRDCSLIENIEVQRPARAVAPGSRLPLSMGCRSQAVCSQAFAAKHFGVEGSHTMQGCSISVCSCATRSTEGCNIEYT